MIKDRTEYLKGYNAGRRTRRRGQGKEGETAELLKAVSALVDLVALQTNQKATPKRRKQTAKRYGTFSIRKRWWKTPSGEDRSAFLAEWRDASGARRFRNFNLRREAVQFVANGSGHDETAEQLDNVRH
jgi:hypothetical protein